MFLELDIEMANHDYFMGLALDQARKAYECSEVPVGAVVVGGEGQVLSRAHNAPIAMCDPTAHAEILALRHASCNCRNYRLSGTILYSTLEPCAMCIGAMLHARIALLVYGAHDSKSGAAGSVMDLTSLSVFNHHIQVIHGVRQEECSGILKRFFRERRKLLDGKI
jgi:tRNA(Arg) A34 adenosine deaminase TadA